MGCFHILSKDFKIFEPIEFSILENVHSGHRVVLGYYSILSLWMILHWRYIKEVMKGLTNSQSLKVEILGENLKFVRTNTIRQIEKIKEENGTKIMDLKDILRNFKRGEGIKSKTATNLR